MKKEIYFIYDLNDNLKETVYFDGVRYFSSKGKDIPYIKVSDFASSKTVLKTADDLVVYSAIEKI